MTEQRSTYTGHRPLASHELDVLARLLGRYLATRHPADTLAPPADELLAEISAAAGITR